jgi:predicted RNase H-like HicB family nuclease
VAVPGISSRIGADVTTRQFQVILEWDSDDRVWVTYVPGLDFLSTYGDTGDEALAQTREAILGYLEAAAMEGLAIPIDDSTELIQLEVAV